MSIDVMHQNGNVVITATANSTDGIVGTEYIRGRICGVDRVGMYHAYALTCSGFFFVVLRR